EALAHDPDVQDAYFDGVLWVELGEKPDYLLAVLSDLITRLTGVPPGLETINAAASALGEALGDRRILMIVDDVWREQDLRPFLYRGPNTTRLITTRIANVLPASTIRQPVDAMRDNEALKLLASGLPSEQATLLQQQLAQLAARLGEWALLVKIVNAFLRDRVLRARQPLADALKGVNKRLDEKGLVAFDARTEGDRSKAIARTIGVSLDLLNASTRRRLSELCIFPEDTDIPIAVVWRLWAETGELDDETDTEDLLSDLYGLSLLLDLNFDQRTIRFHDTVRNFLRDQAETDDIVCWHQSVLKGLHYLKSMETDRLTRAYFYRFLPFHLAEAGDRDRLNALLLDPDWLKTKLAATGDPMSLVADYEHHGFTPGHTLIERILRLTAGIYVRDPDQLLAQLICRLMTCEPILATDFHANARKHLVSPAILTQRLSLTPPGAETARVVGHTDRVRALCVLPNGRLASGSSDATIRIWDTKTGAEVRRLQGHTRGVSALCVLSDGRLASGSTDNTIRVWDLKTGSELSVLKGHESSIWALCVLADGRLVSASDDETVRLWDVESGLQTNCIQERSGSVNALCLLPDGRLATGSRHAVRLWNLSTKLRDKRLDGNSLLVTALCMLPNGCLASGSFDMSIRLWNLETGSEAGRLEGHSRG